MIKYQSTENAILWQEVPSEISLGISLTNCQFKCKGCHSAHLRKDVGSELTNEIIDDLMKDNPYISCVCILGEGKDPDRLYDIIAYIKTVHNKKICLYTANPVSKVKRYVKILDYLKTGPYSKKHGPLSSPTTNQRMYRIINGVISEDITHCFIGK